ncbi:MAG: DUF3995 domain-containing protein [Coriobacteriales bacterium]|jgi:hypothetical protein|nr:DUF3995 domain-containing protein [Coriobacteriales bacterium]
MLFAVQSAIALVLSAVFIALAVVHIAWGLGYKWGGINLLPQDLHGMPLFNPGAAACFATGLICMFPVAIFLARVGILVPDIPAWVPSVGVWGVAAVLLLRAIGDFRYAGLTKRIRMTEFARRDTRFYTPFCIIVALLCVIIQLL